MGGLVKVKRDGPRGWHWIEASRFDPAIHEELAEAETADAESQDLNNMDGAEQAPPKAKRGRPRKQP